MKRFQLVVGLLMLGMASHVLAQKPIVYKDNSKNPRMIIQGNEGYFVPGESFELSGNVQIKRMSADGTKVEMLMTCNKATGKLVKASNKIEVDNVRMTGGITFTQTNEDGTVTTTGDSADYDLKGSINEINVNGSVHVDFGGQGEHDVISKTGQKQTVKVTSSMTTTSKSATLTFKRKIVKQKEIAELQSALVRGPIVFNGTQLTKDSNGTKEQKVAIKADKMTYALVGDPQHPEVRLEGNLDFREIDGKDEGATVEGANLLILQLNVKNQITKLQFKASEGQQVTTTVTRNTDDGKKGGR